MRCCAAGTLGALHLHLTSYHEGRGRLITMCATSSVISKDERTSTRLRDLPSRPASISLSICRTAVTVAARKG